MKKYLMMGAAALAFGFAVVSCSSNDDIYNPDAQSDLIVANYQKAFIHVFGQPAANHTWGFGSPTRATRSGNTGETYPATHEYKDANGNVIAGANMNHNEWGDPKKEYGGWIVPDPLTEGQKLRVKAYFQSKPDISYEDPHFRHFFVQQVYKGATAPGPNSTEVVKAANGSEYTSANMNQLTVGEANSHINDFNAGTCKTSNVLNHEKKTQEDEITLMVNVDDTSCFGYHDTGSSDQSSASPNHNDKMALVAASVIDAWAEANKAALIESGEYGEAVDDKWHRSFMGFDLAIKEGEQAYAKDNDGNVMYADYSQAPTSPAYAWDGEKVFPIREITEIQHEGWSEKVVGDYLDDYKTIMKVMNDGKYSIGWLTTNKNFYIAANQITLTKEYSNGEIEQSSLNDESLKNVLVFKDVKVPGAQNNKAHVINLKRIMELVDEGYLPVKDKNLTEWVKVGVSDGVFSDWIVTLTEAKRISVSLRVMAEDLSAGEDGDDFDFNDVVFDVTRVDETHAKITLQAAGGTLPLRINSTNGEGGWEVHQLFGVANNVMVNTNAKAKGLTGIDDIPAVTQDAQGNDLIVVGNFPETENDFNAAVRDYIHVEVQKVVNGEPRWFELTAPEGQAACKIGVPTNIHWAWERTNVSGAFNFSVWVQNPNEPLIPTQQ
jgi:hypothetical protein